MLLCHVLAALLDWAQLGSAGKMLCRGWFLCVQWLRCFMPIPGAACSQGWVVQYACGITGPCSAVGWLTEPSICVVWGLLAVG